MEKREAEKEGFFDSLFFNTSGFLAETTVANIFLLKMEGFILPMKRLEYFLGL